MGTWPAGDSYPAFIAAHQRRLLRFAYLVTGDRTEAEDVVQDALIKVARRWHRIRPEGALSYLTKALTNEALQHKRRARDIPADLTVMDISAISEDLLRLEEDQAFLARLRQLPTKQRAAVILRYYVDLPDNEIASHLHCSPQTVRSQIHRALDHLRKLDHDSNGAS